jgi:hypothetical protein
MAMTRMRNELKQLTTITLGAQLWFIELANTNSPDAAGVVKCRGTNVSSE